MSARWDLKHPLPVRITHWINAPTMAVMAWSGLMILWPYAPYRIGLGDWTLTTVLSDESLAWLGFGRRLKEGLSWHLAFAWLFVINGLVYVTYLLVSGEVRHLLPDRRSPYEAFLVMLHDLRLRRDLPPQGRYNAGQRIAYTSAILMGVGLALSGLAIWKPTQLSFLTNLLGGYQWARWLHFWLMIGVAAFVTVHVAQVAKAGWNNFRAMITGYERIAPADHGSPAAAPAPVAKTPDAKTPADPATETTP